MNQELLRQKTDMILADLTNNGGVLVPKQQNKFIRTMQEQAILLQDVRMVPMDSPKMEINKVNLGTRLLHPASQDTSASSTYQSGRELTAAGRVKPVTSKVTLSTNEVIAQVNLGYEILEDNIERQDFANTLLFMLARDSARDLEDVLINGDTTSGDDLFAMMNGVLAQSSSNVVDAAGAPIDASLLSRVAKAMPKQFRELPANYYITSNAEIDMRNTIASRNTGLGDAMLTGRQPIQIHSGSVRGVHKMPTGSGIYTDPRNIIVGMQRNISIETMRWITSREIRFVLTFRFDVKLEEERALVKLINAAV